METDGRAEPGDGSITRCVGDLKAGDQAAAQVLWERYFDHLVRLARRRLAISRRGGADEDEEDAALAPSTVSAPAWPAAVSPGWSTATTSGGSWS